MYLHYFTAIHSPVLYMRVSENNVIQIRICDGKSTVAIIKVNLQIMPSSYT